MDFEVCSPPTDSVSALEFSPGPDNQLCAASWDQTVRTWNVEMNGTATPRAYCKLNEPILDVSWSDDGSKIYICTTGCEVYQWDLHSNQLMQVGVHAAGVRSCHWCNSCLVTGSWDKTLKFWDTRTAVPMYTRILPDRCFACDVQYPLIAVSCANRSVVTCNLQNTLMEFKCQESLLKQQHRCINIFRDTQGQLAGFVVAGIEGRAAVHHLNSNRSSYTIRCHCSTCPAGYRNIYAVNDIKHHPVHNTLATVGSDGVFAFWDTNVRDNLFSSKVMDQPLTKCCFSADGQIFAYALGYDWAQGHEHFDVNKKPRILLHPCFDQMKPMKAFPI